MIRDEEVLVSCCYGKIFKYFLLDESHLLMVVSLSHHLFILSFSTSVLFLNCRLSLYSHVVATILLLST